MKKEFANLNELLKEKFIFVVLNNSINENSTKEEIKRFTLNAWELDNERALKPDFIIGIKNGVGISCYRITGVGKIKSNNKIFFGIVDDGEEYDYSDLVAGIDFIKLGIKTNHNAVQYINC